MIPQELPAIRTPVTWSELAVALCTVYRAIKGQTPKRESIFVLLAQSAIETGWWKSCMCWNLGNVKSRDGDGRCWTFYRCSEILDGKEVFFDRPSPQARFRAFQTLAEGAIDHVSFLAQSSRYAGAWAEVVAGRPREFVRALKAAGYFTAAEQPYEDSVARIFDGFIAREFEVPPDDPPMTDAERDRILALVTATSNDATEAFRSGSPLPSDDAPPTERNT